MFDQDLYFDVFKILHGDRNALNYFAPLNHLVLLHRKLDSKAAGSLLNSNQVNDICFKMVFTFWFMNNKMGTLIHLELPCILTTIVNSEALDLFSIHTA